MIKTVFLDLDDTILDFQLAEHKAIRAALLEVGIEPSDEVVDRYIEINRSCWAALERGELTREVVLIRRFELLFSELGVEISPERTQVTQAAQVLLLTQVMQVQLLLSMVHTTSLYGYPK